MKIGQKNRKSHGALWELLLCLLSLAIAFGNLAILYNSAGQQLEELGDARLQQVSDQVQKTLDDSKVMLLLFAADVEVHLQQGADEAAMYSYLRSKSRLFQDQSGGTFMNAYICTEDWILISNATLPENYEITERDWYIATIRNGVDNIYTSAPYVDAFTGEMCFTTSLLLSDGKTIVCIDYDLARFQGFVAEMDRGGDEALIVSRDGIVIAYSGRDLAGQQIQDALPAYMDVYTRLLTEQNDSLILETSIDGQASKVFCNRSGEWMLLYKAQRGSMLRMPYLWIWFSFVLDLALLVGVFLIFLAANRDRRQAEQALEDRESFLNGLSDRMREPLHAIMRDSAAGEGDTLPQIRRSAQTLSDMMENLFSYKEVRQGRETAAQKERESDQALATVRRVRNGIMAAMLMAIAVGIAFTAIVLVGWGNDRMEREIASYNNQLENWTYAQMQSLNMFVDTIAANPAILDDYDFAVEYLDRIVRNHPEISAAYIARPGTAHEMTMNNGWVPNVDYVVAEREWYVATDTSENGFNISTPYLDARTGLYCVTFSRVVNDAVTGERIGIFALDFYIASLTNIMESSYSDSGYAFLVDNANVIINHPDPDYQISGAHSVNIVGTEYDGILDNSAIHFIRDYDGKPRVCISRTESVTGFTVVAVKDLHAVYGVVFLSACVFILLLVVCIVLLYRLVMWMIRWQEDVRQALTEEAARASRADRAKSVFLAQMSHEIRTPINAVLGMNEMILRESSEKAILDYAANAYSAGNTLLSIINDVLDISKIEEGKMEIVEADYVLRSLINDCYNMTADRARQKGLDFTVKVDENLPARLYGDMFHIRQVILNLLTNAVKYTNTGRVELKFESRREDGRFFLRVTVSDTGIGIKPENLPHLFDSFERFDLERNQSVEGAGLGLAICKQLSELMHGAITVESVYGLGSTFCCELPQRVVGAEVIGAVQPDRPVEKPSPAGKQSFTAPSATLLVVDDMEMNLKVFTSLLRHHKMQIDTADSGKRCLELIAQKKYDIIFMDHMMPEMDGIETLAHIQKMDTANRNTPVVMLTADAISGEKEKFLAAGFVHYLTKPIRSEHLDRVIVEFLPSEKVVWGAAPASGKAESTQATPTKTESAPGRTQAAVPARGITGAASTKAAAAKAEAASAGAAPAASGKREEKRSGEDALFSPALGMSYTGEGSYREILASFVEGGPARYARITTLFAREDWKNYVIEVHALKSGSLTIGSTQLSQAALALEQAGKAGDYDTIKKKNAALLMLYQTVLALGTRYLADLPAPEPEPQPAESDLTETPRQTVLEWLDGILAAGDAFDGDEMVAFCDKAAGCCLNGKPLEPLFRGIRQAAQDFEYDAAVEKAKQLAAAIREEAGE